MMRFVFIITGSLLIGSVSVCFADSTEAWVRKASNAVVEAAQGNPQGALNQVIPSHLSLPTRMDLRANTQGLSVNQRINPPSLIASKHLRLSGNYNAVTTFRKPVRIGQTASVTAQNKYFTNTTSISPKLPIKKS